LERNTPDFPISHIAKTKNIKITINIRANIL
jgi:hypothetical protein